jgi:hypothetical protein
MGSIHHQITRGAPTRMDHLQAISIFPIITHQHQNPITIIANQAPITIPDPRLQHNQAIRHHNLQSQQTLPSHSQLLITLPNIVLCHQQIRSQLQVPLCH